MPNFFSALQDDDSGDDAPKQVSQAPQQQQQPNGAKPAQVGNARSNQPNARGRPDYPQRGTGRKVYGGDAAPPADEPEKRAGGDRDAGRGRGGKGPRGGRGGRGSGSRFADRDRHSRTGIATSAKQEEQGWGGQEGQRELQQEIDGGLDAQNDASGAATPAKSAGDAGWDSPAPVTGDNSAWDAPSATPEANAKTPEGLGNAADSPAPVVEEDNTKTYEQYLAEQKEASGLSDKLGSINIRKANEGADDAQWKNAKPLEKDEQDNYFGVKQEAKNKKKAPKEGKTYIEVEARFPRPGGDRGRGGRGGRGGDRDRGDRGGRGRGRFNSSSPRDRPSQAVDTNDSSAFPSLS